MLRHAWTGRCVAGIAALSMIATPAMAASRFDTRSVDPMVAMALLSSPQSRDTLCAARVGSAATDPALVAEAAATAPATTTSTSGQTVVQGCVLPIAEAAPVASGVQTAAVTVPNYSLGLPVLLLAAGVALLAAIKGFGDDGEGDGAPLSPA